MPRTKPRTRVLKRCNPPVAGIRVMNQERTIWFANAMKDSDRIEIGRTRHRDIRLDDATVSCVHCELVREPDGRYLLRDRKSTNSIWVSRCGIYGPFRKKKRVHLELGMHIEIGEVTIIPVDEEGDALIVVRRFSELYGILTQVYGSAAEAARRFGGRSRQTISRAISTVKKRRRA